MTRSTKDIAPLNPDEPRAVIELPRGRRSAAVQSYVDQQIVKLIELLDAGTPMKEVAEILGHPEATCRGWHRAYGRAQEIARGINGERVEAVLKRCDERAKRKHPLMHQGRIMYKPLLDERGALVLDQTGNPVLSGEPYYDETDNIANDALMLKAAAQQALTFGMNKQPPKEAPPGGEGGGGFTSTQEEELRAAQVILGAFNRKKAGEPIDVTPVEHSSE